MHLHCIKSMILLAMIVPFCSFAANLVQFQAGQPAKAAEVNANFNALNNELTALKSFNNLSNEQVAALKAAIQAQGLRWTEQQVDCSNNPYALMELYAAQGAGLVYMGLTIKGDCFANLSQQFHGLTLSLRATAEQPARLLPDGTAWQVTGGFNGGLYLSNLTLEPPAEATAVLFSRVAQGAVDNVIIEGGGSGVVVQAGAQAYLTNVQIKDSKYNGIRVMSGGNVRLFHNIPNTKVVDTTTGNGIVAEQAEIGVGSSISVKAPQAIVVQAGGSFAQTVAQTPNRVSANGNVTLYSGSQLHAQELVMSGNLYAQQAKVTTAYLEVTGNTSLHDSASLFTNALKLEGQTFLQSSALSVSNNSDITGKIQVARHSSLILKRGVLRAVAPASMDYQQSAALELDVESTAAFGDYRDPAGPQGFEFVVNGQIYMLASTLSSDWTQFNGNLAAGASVVRLNYSVINAPGRDANDINTVSIYSGSSLLLYQSDVFARLIYLNGSSGTANDAEFGSSPINVHNNARFEVNRCSGSGSWNLDSGQLNLLDCQMGSSAMFASLGSKVRMFGGQFGVAHLDLGSVGSFTNMTLTGNSQLQGINNYFIGAGAVMMLDNVTLTQTKHFDNNHVLRLATNSVMANSTLSCSPKAYVEWWQSAASLGNTGNCNVP